MDFWSVFGLVFIVLVAFLIIGLGMVSVYLIILRRGPYGENSRWGLVQSLHFVFLRWGGIRFWSFAMAPEWGFGAMAAKIIATPGAPVKVLKYIGNSSNVVFSVRRSLISDVRVPEEMRTLWALSWGVNNV